MSDDVGDQRLVIQFTPSVSNPFWKLENVEHELLQLLFRIFSMAKAPLYNFVESFSLSLDNVRSSIAMLQKKLSKQCDSFNVFPFWTNIS